MQAQGDVSVFGGVGAGFFNTDLVKGQLLSAFACYVFEFNGFVAKVFQRQAVHVVFGGDRIQYVGFEHGIEFNAF